MRKISQKAKRVFGPLIEQAAEEKDNHIKIDNAEGVFMALSVQRTAHDAECWSFAHYYEQHGDLMADPEVVLFKSPVDGELYPVSIQQPFPPGVRKVVEFEDGKPVRYSKKGMRDIAVFCTQWAENIKQQQGL